MNSNYCEDLTDYYNYPLNANDPFDWLREELRTAAKNHFDHLIVRGFLTERAKNYMSSQKITVEQHGENTIFSGWTKTKEFAKYIDSPFSLRLIEKDDKLFAEQLKKQRKEEENEFY